MDRVDACLLAGMGVTVGLAIGSAVHGTDVKLWSQEAAGWVQAVGSIGAILGAVWSVRFQFGREVQRKQAQDADGVAMRCKLVDGILSSFSDFSTKDMLAKQGEVIPHDRAVKQRKRATLRVVGLAAVLRDLPVSSFVAPDELLARENIVRNVTDAAALMERDIVRDTGADTDEALLNARLVCRAVRWHLQALERDVRSGKTTRLQ